MKKPEKEQRVASSSEGGAGGAWSVVRFSALAMLLLELASSALVLSDRPASLGIEAVVISVGSLVLMSLVALGAWRRARWALWLGGIVTALGAPLIAASTFGWMRPEDQMDQPFVNTPLSIALAWGQVGAYTAFLVGLVMLRRARKR